MKLQRNHHLTPFSLLVFCRGGYGVVIVWILPYGQSQAASEVGQALLKCHDGLEQRSYQLLADANQRFCLSRVLLSFYLKAPCEGM